MRRFTTILLCLTLSTYVTCSIVTKDVPIKDAEQENSAAAPEVAPVAPVDEVVQPNSACDYCDYENTANVACAKVGEFCIGHKDCCSNACLGYLKRCVSGREFVTEDE